MRALGAALALLVLAACDDSATTRLAGDDYMSVRTWTDPATQCEYILALTPRSVAITPRAGASGAQICGGPQ